MTTPDIYNPKGIRVVTLYDGALPDDHAGSNRNVDGDVYYYRESDQQLFMENSERDGLVAFPRDAGFRVYSPQYLQEMVGTRPILVATSSFLPTATDSEGELIAGVTWDLSRPAANLGFTRDGVDLVHDGISGVLDPTSRRPILRNVMFTAHIALDTILGTFGHETESPLAAGGFPLNTTYWDYSGVWAAGNFNRPAVNAKGVVTSKGDVVWNADDNQFYAFTGATAVTSSATDAPNDDSTAGRWTALGNNTDRAVEHGYCVVSISNESSDGDETHNHVLRTLTRVASRTPRGAYQIRVRQILQTTNVRTEWNLRAGNTANRESTFVRAWALG